MKTNKTIVFTRKIIASSNKKRTNLRVMVTNSDRNIISLYNRAILSNIII